MKAVRVYLPRYRRLHLSYKCRVGNKATPSVRVSMAYPGSPQSGKRSKQAKSQLTASCSSCIQAGYTLFVHF